MIKNIKSALVGIFAALAFCASAPATALTVQADGSFNPQAPASFGPRVDQTFTASASGQVSFGWGINATYEGPILFNAGFLVNGVETSLSTSWIDAVLQTTGVGDFAVSAGDSYGFFVYSVYFDSEFGNGSGFLTITDLNVPGNNVPEPGSLALLGVGLVGLAAMRRRKPM